MEVSSDKSSLLFPLLLCSLVVFFGLSACSDDKQAVAENNTPPIGEVASPNGEAPEGAIGSLSHDQRISLKYISDGDVDDWSESYVYRIDMQLDSLAVSNDSEIDISYVTILAEGVARFDKDIIDERCQLIHLDDPGIYCILANDDKSDGLAFKPIEFSLRRKNSDDFLLKATLVASEYDSDEENNTIDFPYSILGRAVNYGVYGAPYISLPLDSNKVSYQIRFQQHNTTNASEVVITGSLPEGSVVESVIPTVGYAKAPWSLEHCSFDGTEITCSFDDASTGFVDVVFYLADVYESGHTMDWRLQSSRGDSDEANNSLEVPIYQTPSTDLLQELINNAVNDDVVDLPSGIYHGTIDGRGKRLHVRGSSEGDRTILLAPSISNIGEYSLYENLHVLSDQTAFYYNLLEPMTIANSHFEPIAGSSPRYYGLIGGQSIHLINNHFENYGQVERTNCGFLIRLVNQGLWYGAHNTFENINCSWGAISFEGDEPPVNDNNAAIPSRSIFTNNTFINNDLLLTFNHNRHSVLFSNNIVVGSSRLFDVNLNNGYFKDQGGFESSNNLMFNSSREQLINDELLAIPGFSVATPDVSFDPIFVDTESGDFTLSPASTAVDQSDDSAGSAPTNWFEPTNLVLAIDGLGDGNVVLDLGAKEYKP